MVWILEQIFGRTHDTELQLMKANLLEVLEETKQIQQQISTVIEQTKEIQYQISTLDQSKKIQEQISIGNKYIVVTAIVTSVGLAGYILWRWYPYPWNNIKERWQRNWRLRGISPLEVVVPPGEIKLPTKTTTLTAYCTPVATTGSCYKYKWTLIYPDGEEEDDRLKRVVLHQKQHELKLSNLEEGAYHITVTVTGNQRATTGLRGEATGKVTVLPGPSVTGIPRKIPIEFAKKEGNIWSNNNDTIKELPDFLEGTILFQLPFKAIPAGSSLSIVSDEWSDIFIAHEEKEGEEIFEKNLTKLRWNKKEGEVRITRSNINSSKQLDLSTIWHRRIKPGGTHLPEIQISNTAIAIFIKEDTPVNKEISATNVGSVATSSKDLSCTVSLASSVTSTSETEIQRCENVQEDNKIWNNNDATIYELPYFLKGATLFQLPYENIQKGTVFSIFSREPSADVYIAQKEGEKRGWCAFELIRQSWSQKNGKVRVMFAGEGPSVLGLSKIWHTQTKGQPASTELPPLITPETIAAIFVVEGNIVVAP